ncbi:hypothetical protein GPECTOR_199g353 [Gonium pectorale]|uniref:Uncharacterized protein n=1 Tax=Gonium pectorale TaxID=33097 RepID=A0A150FY56_GONPE|nr:hypothetical protein GPECTOR_199g353 [Gonium pectorale]|eukprot:KXZ42125.1 hypothetical protein GPECTOR_199g353 [Gonium pectorale]
MPTVHCICGVSGSGKSYYRQRDVGLSSLPCIDIADVYDEFPGIGRDRARLVMLDRLEQHLRCDSSSIVLEAFFAPGKLQRRGVEALANDYDVSVRYIWCAVSRAEAHRRIMDDYHYGRDDWRRHQFRVAMINDVPDKYFYERDGEGKPLLAAGACARCGEQPFEVSGYRAVYVYGIHDASGKQYGWPPACAECGGDSGARTCCDCASRHDYHCSSRCKRAASRRNRSHGHGSQDDDCYDQEGDCYHPGHDYCHPQVYYQEESYNNHDSDDSDDDDNYY